MVDPVFNRPMFQGAPMAQGANLPLTSAKGTGITSMVTPPDQGAQQLKAFANPMNPTIRGFADGGFAITGPTADQNGFNAYNAFLNNREGLADNAVRTDTKMGVGTPMDAGAASTIMNNYTASLQNTPAVSGNSVSPLSQSASRANLAAPKTTSLGSGDSYDIFKSGVSPTQATSGSPSISGKGVIIQTYANGGPVQHFQEGGVASMWDNFVNSLTIKEPNKSGNYRLPDVGLRIGQQSDYRKDAGITGGGANYVEPIDIGGPDATMSEAQRNAVYMRNSAAQQAEDPRVAANLENDAAVRERQQQTRDAGIPAAARIREAAGTGAREAVLPRVLNQHPAPDLLEQQQMEMDREARRGAGFGGIGHEPPPPMPKEGFQIDVSKPKGEIATNLADIKAERASQSAADRRENALMALMSAGFGMAAGKSRHALTNIAEGGQQGIGTFAQLEKGRREDENRRYLAALHEKEVGLRERELKAREPLIAAQTKAQEQLPEYREKMNQVRADVARSHAQQMADKAFKDIMANPMSPEFKAISADKTGTVAPAIKKKLEETYFGAKYKELMLQQQDSLGIKSVSQPSE